MLKADEMILAWAKKKYKDTIPADTTAIKFETEERDAGFCPTCSSPYTCVVVWAVHPPIPKFKRPRYKWNDTATSTEIDELRDVQIHEVIIDIINNHEDSSDK